MKIRILKLGSATNNICSADFELPEPSNNKGLKVVSVTCPDMPLMEALTGALVVVSASLSVNQTVDMPTISSMIGFVEYLNLIRVSNTRVFEAYFTGGELEMEVLAPFDTVAVEVALQSALMMPATLNRAEWFSVTVDQDRFDASLETEVRVKGLHIDGIHDGSDFTNRVAVFGRDKKLSGEVSTITGDDTAVRVTITFLTVGLVNKQIFVPNTEAWGITLELM